MPQPDASPQSCPDIAALGRWLTGWIRSDGAIHGFHTHPMWGGNPFRHGTFYSGHSAAAMPLLAGVATILKKGDDSRARALLEQAVRYQLNDLAGDGQFNQVGLQFGDAQQYWLLWNAIANVGLVECVAVLGDGMAHELAHEIEAVTRRHLEACDVVYGALPTAEGAGIDEYARCWARLRHMQVFRHRTWSETTEQALKQLRGLHRRGVPDEASVGLEATGGAYPTLESPEMLGIPIQALRLAAKFFNQADYLRDAHAISRHVIRSAWRDHNQRRRLHRQWTMSGEEGWTITHEPALIAGMGLTLAAIEALSRVEDDPEAISFLADMDRTYISYQCPSGCFLAASGWHNETDVAPSSVWHGFDFYHLAKRHMRNVQIHAGFWDRMLAEANMCSVILGDSTLWIEDRDFWLLRGYQGCATVDLAGRKDHERFGLDGPVATALSAEDPQRLPDEPLFQRTEGCIFHVGGRLDLQVMVADASAYSGPRIRDQVRTAGSSLTPVSEAPDAEMTLHLNIHAARQELSVLPRVPVFEPLTHAEIRELAREVTRKQFYRNDPLIRQGEEGACMYVLAEGEVEVIVEDPDRKHQASVTTIEPGDTVGEMSLLTGEPRSATVIAKTHVIAYEITREVMRKMIAKRPEIAMGIAQVVAERRQRGERALAAAEASERERESRSLFKRINAIFQSNGKD